jgi:hypothetical protein
MQQREYYPMNTLAKLGIIASIIGGMSAIIFLADWYYDIHSKIDKGYELSVNNEKNIKSIEEKLDKLIAGQDSVFNLPLEGYK